MIQATLSSRHISSFASNGVGSSCIGSKARSPQTRQVAIWAARPNGQGQDTCARVGRQPPSDRSG